MSKSESGKKRVAPAAPYSRRERKTLDLAAPWWPADALIVGADEAGRGCIAGPLVVAGCVLPPGWRQPVELRDSKKMTEAERERVYEALVADRDVYFCVHTQSAERIDEQRNILASVLGGFARCIEMAARDTGARRALVDGNRMPRAPEGVEVRTVVKGDDAFACIAAASVVAKVTRDRYMAGEVHAAYPEFGFAAHKGYGEQHVERMKREPPCHEHRTYFAPFKAPAGAARPAPRARLSWGAEREWTSADVRAAPAPAPRHSTDPADPPTGPVLTADKSAQSPSSAPTNSPQSPLTKQ